ncbi:MAG: VWA domain-containing protein [Methanophagales archaeon ANME-1-THS]|nr:MAG: VWA domain-containing protein [Methanophagales archaeon ANME-1-THS]
MSMNKAIILAALISIFCVTVSIGGVCAETGAGVEVGASVDPAAIESESTTRVEITMTGNEMSEATFPIDVALAIDCSGSMDRYGTIIAGPNDVTLTTGYQKVGEFSTAEVATVEIMLQIPVDIYYDKDYFSAYLKNKATGIETSKKSAYSTTRWSSVEPGEYEVYAKLNYASGTAGRTFAVELQPVRIDSAKGAAKTFVDSIKENDHVALVKFHSSGWSYSSYCVVVQGLTSDKNAVKNKIDTLNAGGGTPLGEGLKKAVDHLDLYGRSDTVKAIILLTDGWWNMGCDPLEQADRAAAKGYTVYTIGWGGVNVTSLTLIAERTGGRAYFPATEDDLVEIYEELAMELSSITAKNTVLSMELGADVTYAGNANVAPEGIYGKTVTWNVGTIALGQTESISFDVLPQAAGTVRINTEDSKVTYKDAFDASHEVPVPVLSVQVIPPQQPPVARFTVSPDTPMTNQSVTFDASASYDPDGYIKVYKWDFDGNGTWDLTGNVIIVKHSYDTSDIYNVKLEVEDNAGARASKIENVTVVNGPGEEISGNVTWSGKHSFEGLGERIVIGEARSISATAYEITNTLATTVYVTVELRVDGIPLSSNTIALGPLDQTSITVSATWVPMSSGMHRISLHAYDGEYWVPPTNDPTIGVGVFIEKVS